MIVDQLKNWQFYQGLPSRLLRAIEFLQSPIINSLPLGRHELKHDGSFALVQEYTTKPIEECMWEAHRRYCDVQFLASGRERIGIAPIDRMRVDKPYDADRDVAFYSGDGDFITLQPEMFAVFAPQDVHMPCLAANSPTLVRKIVVKVEL